jgi:asparagine synthase (glutamine-hydrolysing)
LRAECFPALNAAIGASRLSLVDLTHGSQPISNEDGSVWCVLNGEIYNYSELADDLRRRGHRFRSGSDTEVLVHLYEERGEAMFPLLHGMYALAILDRRERRFLIARDHMGMKPVYFATRGQGFAFASDARALFAGGLLAPVADWRPLARYYDFGYVPAPDSAFEGVGKLLPGCWLRWQDGESSVQRHWEPPVEEAGFAADAPEQLGRLLRQATRRHLQGDVEVGCFLSGGWDSSVVAALAREHLGKLKTFSLVLPEHPAADESSYARRVAQALGTEHYEVEFRAAMLPELLSESVWHLEEPASSTPAVLAGILSGLAAAHVKTVIGGEGADELFAGYEWLRPQLPYHLRRVTPRWLAKMGQSLAPDFRWRRALRQIAATSEDEIHFEFVRRSHPSDILWPGPVPVAHSTGADAFRMVAEQLGEAAVTRPSDRLARRLLLEQGGRLPGGILFANDRMSMAHGLEVRMPFLDRSVVEYAFRLPSRWKLWRGQEKAILRPLVEQLIPVVAKRRKQGLHVPELSLRTTAMREFSYATLLSPHSLFPRKETERLLQTWFSRQVRELRFLQTMLRLQLWWDTFVAPGSRGRTLWATPLAAEGAVRVGQASG